MHWKRPGGGGGGIFNYYDKLGQKLPEGGGGGGGEGAQGASMS